MSKENNEIPSIEEETSSESEKNPNNSGMDKKKKAIIGCVIAIGVVLGIGGIVNANSQDNKTEEKTVETTKKEKTKTLGEKKEDATKISLNNKTQKDITVVETKSSSEEDFSDNLLEDGDIFANNEKRTLYATVQNDDTLNLKIGFKDEDTSYTFEGIETDQIKTADIKLDENNEVVINVVNKDHTVIETVKPTETDKKSEEEKKNEEEAEKEETTSKSDASSSTDKTNASSSTNTNSNSTSSNSSSASTSTNKNNSSNTNTSNASSSKQHTHNWVAQYKTVHHDAVYDQKYVVDQAAWSEEVSICNVCGANITGDPAVHAEQHALAGEGSGHHGDVIYHPEQGHYENVLVSAAYDEQVVSGYKCSTCGATK